MEKPENDSVYDLDSYEDIFWLQVLGDHMRIFIGTLEAKEKDLLAEAKELRDKLDELLLDARVKNLDQDDVARTVEKVRKYKLTMISLRTMNQVGLNLPPFFPSHMLNELEEYEKIIRGAETTDIIGQHKLWLNDAVGHVDSLISDLDITEKIRKKELKGLMKKFECLYQTTLETKGFTRTVHGKGSDG